MSGNRFFDMRNIFTLESIKKIVRLERFPRVLRTRASVEDIPLLKVPTSRIPTRSQLRFLTLLMSRPEKILLLVLAVAWVAATGLFLWSHVRTHLVDVPVRGGTYVEGVVGTPRLINPVLAVPNSVDADLVRLVFSGLFRYNENRELVTDLASEYHVSEDGKEYTVTLNTGVSWHDGEALTVDDVLFTISAIQDTAWHSPLAPSFKGISAEKVDDATVKFTLKEPFAPFPSLLTVGLLPQHVWSTVPPESVTLSELNMKPIGTGPFKVKEFTHGKRSGTVRSYHLEPNPYAYSQSVLLAHLFIVMYPDRQTLVTDLNARKIDGALLSGNTGDLRRKDVNKKTFILPRETAIFMNQGANPVLKDAAIREALLRSIDRERLVAETLAGNGIILDDPVPSYELDGPSLPASPYPYDIGRTAELLDGAGWKLVDGTRTKDGKQLTVALSAADTAENAELISYIKQSWESVGIVVQVAPVDQTAILRDVIKPRKYELVLFRIALGDDPDPYPFWHSSQAHDPGLNLSLFANRQADELLEAARKERNPEERAKKYAAFDELVRAQIPALFIYQDSTTYALDHKLKGVTGDYLGTSPDRFAGVASWYISTRKVWH